VARNRKRTRDRRPRSPADASALATANGEPVDAPQPLSHATPDSELVEAQLALGRPELSEVPGDEELEALAAGSGSGGGRRRRGGVGDDGDFAPAPGGAAAPVRADSLFSRLVHFLVGSWHELQRVQWPDRRQVFQATGVVIGFVIVAGVFLGLADLAASHFVTLILK
jgi:preprotein translocase SecE subunit